MKIYICLDSKELQTSSVGWYFLKFLYCAKNLIDGGRGISTPIFDENIVPANTGPAITTSVYLDHLHSPEAAVRIVKCPSLSKDGKVKHLSAFGGKVYLMFDFRFQSVYMYGLGVRLNAVCCIH